MKIIPILSPYCPAIVTLRTFDPVLCVPFCHSCASFPPHMQASLHICWTALFSLSPSLPPLVCVWMCPCETPQFNLRVLCKISHRLLKCSANTSMCYCSLLLSETAGIFHRSGLSIKRLSPDRLCWWISVRLPRVQMLVSSALLCLTAVCKSYNSSFYLSFCRQSWAICFLALFRDFSDNVDQV